MLQVLFGKDGDYQPIEMDLQKSYEIVSDIVGELIVPTISMGNVRFPVRPYDKITVQGTFVFLNGECINDF